VPDHLHRVPLAEQPPGDGEGVVGSRCDARGQDEEVVAVVDLKNRTITVP
jgi:hypothetical protein